MSQGAEFWNHKYAGPDYVYGTQPNHFLKTRAPRLFSRGMKILSLGEGEGRNAVWLARRGCQMTAVDCSARALEKLRRFAARMDVDIATRCTDVVDFDLGSERWDAVIILHLHLAPRTRRTIHRRVVRALRPGGFVLLEALRPKQRTREKSPAELPEHLYSPKALRRDFRTLHLQHLSVEDRYVEAGEHRGMTSVVNLVGQKVLR